VKSICNNKFDFSDFTHDNPRIQRHGANLGVVRALRSAVLALYVQNLDGSKRFGPRTYPHVEHASHLS
jgi:hypothetical protein